MGSKLEEEPAVSALEAGINRTQAGRLPEPIDRMVALRQGVREHPGGGLLRRGPSRDIYAAASVETAKARMMGDEVQADAPVQRYILFDHEFGGEVGRAKPFAV